MIAFVHGVPETAAIWDDLRDAITRPSVALSLPGFGCERPPGFGATGDDYVDWLLGQLRRIDEPVDLVGHDWGAGLTYRVATEYPDAIRSWVADVASVAHPDYAWHEFAVLWQTPGEGEAWVDAQAAMPPDELGVAYEALGVSAAAANEMAAGFDTTMGRCILDLYRSATPNWHARWGPWEPTAVPGLVVSVTDDPFNDTTQAEEVAGMLGARVATLEEGGHFWPCQAAAPAARALESFWSSLDA